MPAGAPVVHHVTSAPEARRKRTLVALASGVIRVRAALIVAVVTAFGASAIADDTTVRDRIEMTPLMQAARADDAARVAALLSAGADPRESVDVLDPTQGLSPGDTALSLAAEHAGTAVACRLMEAGADVNAETYFHVTPLARAAASNSASMVALLLHAGADAEAMDMKSRTPLMLAALRNDVAVAQRLLALGADLHARDEAGRSTLMWAVGANSRAMAEMLVAAGDDLRHVTDRGETVLMAAAGSREVDSEVLGWLLAQGFDVNAIDARGKTALMAAAGWSRPEVVQMLLDHGADAASRTHNGQLAADFAAANPDIHRTNVYWRLNDARFE